MLGCEIILYAITKINFRVLSNSEGDNISLVYGREGKSHKSSVHILLLYIYSRFLRCCTAKGSCAGLCRVGPAKVKAS